MHLFPFFLSNLEDASQLFRVQVRRLSRPMSLVQGRLPVIEPREGPAHLHLRSTFHLPHIEVLLDLRLIQLILVLTTL